MAVWPPMTVRGRLGGMIAWLALGAAAAGCTLIEPYQGPAASEICGNHLDDDWNGLRDCDDPACLHTTACPEEDLATCTNGLDDDGDGRTDFEDAPCWPFGVATTERCASVLGGMVSSEVWNGQTSAAIDPVGGLAMVTRLTNAGGFATARSNVSLTGALDGTTATVEIYADPVLTTRVDVALTDATTSRPNHRTLGLLLDVNRDGTLHASTQRFVDGAAVVEGDIALFARRGEWFRVEMHIVAGALTVREHLGREAITIPLPADFPEGRALVFGVSATDGTLIGGMTFVRPSWQRCADAPAAGLVPPIGVVLQYGRDSSSCRLAAAHELDGGRVCALAFENNAPGTRLLQALGDGAHWNAVGDAASMYGPGQLPAPGAMLAWNGAALAIDLASDEATAVLGDLGPSGWDYRIAHGRASSCDQLSVGDMLGLPPIEGRTLVGAPPVALERSDAGLALTVLTQRGPSGAPFDLRTYRSPTGEPGTFVADPDGDVSLFDALGPVSADHAPRFDFPRLRRVGSRDHAALVRRWDGRLELWVRRLAGWVQVRGVDLGPSGEDGAFDANAVGLADLVEDAPAPDAWHGRIFYTGEYDGYFGDAAGFGPARLTIVAPGQP